MKHILARSSKFSVCLLLLFLGFSCRKTDYAEPMPAELSSKVFFNTSAAMPEVQEMAEFLKNQNGFLKNLSAFVQKNGVPVWDKTVFSTTGSSNFNIQSGSLSNSCSIIN